MKKNIFLTLLITDMKGAGPPKDEKIHWLARDLFDYISENLESIENLDSKFTVVTCPATACLTCGAEGE